MAVTLQETGYLADIIHHFSETLGIYDNVNDQIIQAAINNGEGPVPYSFDRSYNFRPVLYTFRNFTVAGVFDGDARLEKSNGREYLVINGIMTYTYSDKFEDPIRIVEILQRYMGWSRERAQEYADKVPEIIVTPYDILDQWQTKFNASVDVTGG